MNHEHPPTTEQSDAPPLPVQAEQHETDQQIRPRIWVISLADYATLDLHYAWIDAAREPEEIQADIDSLLASSPCAIATGQPVQEWAIWDSTGFGDCQIGQHEDLDWVSGLARGIAEHGLAFAAWANVVKEEEYLADFDQAYLGHYDSLHAYIEQLINDLGYDELFKRTAPPSIQPYVKIDITATANDMPLGGDLHALPADDGGVWIFDARE